MEPRIGMKVIVKPSELSPFTVIGTVVRVSKHYAVIDSAEGRYTIRKINLRYA